MQLAYVFSCCLFNNSSEFSKYGATKLKSAAERDPRVISKMSFKEVRLHNVKSKKMMRNIEDVTILEVTALVNNENNTILTEEEHKLNTCVTEIEKASE